MNLKIYDNSKNYTAIIVRPKVSQPLVGLDNLVGVTVFGNLCLVPKTYDLSKQYVFFPAECQIDHSYLAWNNMYRDSSQNEDTTAKGYFEDNGRVKAIKLKGNKSTGLLMPVESINNHPLFQKKSLVFNDGDEFNEIDGVEICRKYIVPTRTQGTGAPKAGKLLDSVVDSKQFPEHIDTDHLLKNIHKLTMYDYIAITIKLHGTSGRIGNVLTKRKLTWLEKLAKLLGIRVVEEEYNYVAGSRRVVKSVGFDELSGKNHFYEEDLWTKVSKEFFEGKLNKGEMVYFEVIGKDYTGAEIQKDYTYGFDKPEVFVYRISNINAQGIEVDLPYPQLKERAKQLGLKVPAEIYYGSLVGYLYNQIGAKSDPEMSFSQAVDEMGKYLSERYMDKPSYLDPKVIEEGIVLRVENYTQPKLFKMKAPEFLIHEGKQADKQILDLETANS